MTDRTQLHHLADRARRGVLLPAEGALLADAVTAMAAALNDADQDAADAHEHNEQTCEAVTRADKAEAAIEQAELDAEQQARHFSTVCGERESYRQAWKDEQKRRAAAEAAIERVRNLRAIAPDGAQGPTWAALELAIDNALPAQPPTV